MNYSHPKDLFLQGDGIGCSIVCSEEKPPASRKDEKFSMMSEMVVIECVHIRHCDLSKT